VKCPLCSKKAGAHGWGNGLRRICGLYGTYYLIGTRHICRDCEGETIIMLWQDCLIRFDSSLHCTVLIA